MKIIHEPKIYLVGKSKMVDGGVLDFLRDHETGWEIPLDLEEGHVRDGELLCELAARISPFSFGENQETKGTREFVRNIVKRKHGSCLENATWSFIFTGISRSLSHELVRSRIGWSYCLAGDTVVWSGAKINGEFNGKRKSWSIARLFEWSKNKSKKYLLNKILVRVFDGNVFVPAHVLGVYESGIKDVFKVTMEDGKTIRASSDHPFLHKELGWRVLGELKPGDEIGTNGIAVYKTKEWLDKHYVQDNLSQEKMGELAGVSKHTIKKWIQIHGLQKPMGSWSIGKTPWNKGISHLLGRKLSEQTKDLIRQSKLGEKNPGWKGDDAKPSSGRGRAQRKFKDVGCCSLCGKEGRIERHHRDRNPLNNSPDNVIMVCSKCHRNIHNQEDGHPNALTVRWRKIVSICFDGKETVYDLEVDHPSHNFVANGVIVHNCQRSQRYVNESEANFIEPDIIAEDPELHELWCRSIEASHQMYVLLVDKLSEKVKQEQFTDLSLFERKKLARQSARSVLPNACETMIFVLLNARSARNFLELRASRHADTEIRKLSNRLYEILVQEAPSIFGDYEKVDLGDGTFELKTNYRRI